MPISQINLTSFRNISNLSLSADPQLNLFIGENGSGKTSLLEALYLLGNGARSFRTSHVERIIQYEQPCFQLFVRYMDNNQTPFKVGIERKRKENTFIRLNEETLKKTAPLAKIFPMQLINPHSFRLLEGGPEERRRFLDWGVFHMEPDFLIHWQQIKRLLQQRNAALRQGLANKTIEIWSEPLIHAGEKITLYRNAYFNELLPIFTEVLNNLGDLPPLTLTLCKGWGKDYSLTEALYNALEGDRLMGHSRVGPHRADIKFYCQGVPAKEILSRGQEKLVILALFLARGFLYEKKSQQGCIYLLDDLTAELDEKHQALVLKNLLAMKAQLFITLVHEHLFRAYLSDQGKRFHVKQGEFNLVSR